MAIRDAGITLGNPSSTGLQTIVISMVGIESIEVQHVGAGGQFIWGASLVAATLTMLIFIGMGNGLSGLR